MKKIALVLLTLAASVAPIMAQTLTLLPSSCGSTAYVNCNHVTVAEGGSVWLNFPTDRQGFLQFSDADGVTGTTSSRGYYDGSVALSSSPHTLFIGSFSFIDTDGTPHTGVGRLTYHFYLARGSGRGGGGGGWKLMLDGGTINLQ